MKLTAIELIGFKSFADRALFPVDAPITGIIGPNGCGKSNIVDAVRWVLGESAAKQLRGQMLTDVIFGGSKLRRASGLASVSLHFDNHDHSAGGAFADYHEIVIQRKVSSDGVSEYSINRQRCRRKDIVALLKGSGVGARSYALIEQGMISRIIEAKPEELRVYLEEAAGVGIYKLKRKETERRMQQVHDHLLLHDERLQQLKKQRDRLADEAEIAQQYQQYQQQYAQEQRQLLSWQLHETERSLIAAQNDQQQQEQALETALKTHEEAQKTCAEAASAVERAQLLEKQAQQRYQELGHLHQQAEMRSAREKSEWQHVQQRLAELNQRQQRLAAENADDTAQYQQKKIALETIINESQQCGIHITQLETALTAAREYMEQQRAALRQGQMLCQQQKDNVAHCLSRYEEAKTHWQRLEQRLQTQNAPDEALQATVDVLEETRAAVEMKEFQLEEALSVEMQAQKSAAEAQQILQQQQQALMDAERALDGLKARAETLQQWLPEPRVANQSEKALYETLVIEEKWQSALERYLHPALTAATHNCGIEAAWLGAGAPPKQWQSIIESSYSLQALLGHLQPLALPDSAVDFSTLQEGYYLTLSGSLVGRDCYLPSRAQEHHGLLARYQQLSQLETELQQQQIALTALKQKQHRAQIAAEECQQKYQNAQQLVHHCQRELDEKKHALQLQQQAQTHQQQLHAQQCHARKQLEEDIVEAKNRFMECERDYQHARAQVLPNVAALTDSYQKSEAAFSHGNAELKKTQALQQKYQQERSALQAFLDSYEKQQQRLHFDQCEVETQQEECRARYEQLSAQLTAADAALAEQKWALEEHGVLYQEAQIAAETAQKQWQINKDRLNEASHQAHLLQERLNSRQQYQETLLTRRQEKLAALAENEWSALVFADDAALDETALTRHLRQIKQKIDDLGAVNAAAIAHFAEIDAEFQQLTAQCQDLQQSLALLEEAIAALDKETQARLRETFTAVNQYFGVLFPVLFQGGEGSLTWVGTDLLTAGIALTVRPAGKKVRNISMLSGGEKALTAVALVFALFKLNPAPFCLLDEIDAPLDEANVMRLTALLREMAVNTQFIVITHHKRTMQACDHLIGVTMSEPGVSRLVAVKVAESNESAKIP